jgi:spermidine/putrescine transport system permease protein
MGEVRWFRRLTVGLLASWIALFMLVPNLLVTGASLLTSDEENFVALPLTLESYRQLADPLYLEVLLGSTVLALSATVICLLVSYPFAFWLTRVPARRRALPLALVIIPFWTNSLVRTYAIRTLVATQGPLNKLLIAASVIDAPLPLLYTGGAVVFGLVYVLLPFMILPLYAVMEKLDWRLVEAARDLGAGPLAAFRRVVLPLTLPGIIAGSLMVFLPGVGMFYVADLLGGAKELLVGNLIKNQFLDARNWQFGAALSVALLAVLALLLTGYRYSRRRLGAAGWSQ